MALREYKRPKTEVMRLDAYQGGPSITSAKLGQPTAQDLLQKYSTVPVPSPTSGVLVDTVSTRRKQIAMSRYWESPPVET